MRERVSLNVTTAHRAQPSNGGGPIHWEADMETWRFTYVSSQAEAILGYSPEECLQQDFWIDHIHPEDRE